MLTNPILIEGSLVHSLSGGDPTQLNIVETDIEACILYASSHKCGSLQRTKAVARRHPGESEFLNDIIKWIQISKVQPHDELFTLYMALSNGQAPTRKVLTRSMVRKAMKFEASLNGFPTEFYSSHSLRKAGRTQMSAAGCTTEEMNDRGNYSTGSAVGRTTYDYSSNGHGPLSLNALGGSKVTTDQIRQCIPACNNKTQ